MIALPSFLMILYHHVTTRSETALLNASSLKPKNDK